MDAKRVRSHQSWTHAVIAISAAPGTISSLREAIGSAARQGNLHVAEQSEQDYDRSTRNDCAVDAPPPGEDD